VPKNGLNLLQSLAISVFFVKIRGEGKILSNQNITVW